MAQRGRGNKVPPETVEQVLRLYCEPHYEYPSQFLFNVEDIAGILELDPKTCRTIIRRECTKMLRRYLEDGGI